MSAEDLQLIEPTVALREQYEGYCREFGDAGDIPGNADQPAHITELEGQVAFAVRAPAGFPDDLVNTALVEVRDLPVIFHFLRDEPDIFLLVVRSILHAVCHVHFIA